MLTRPYGESSRNRPYRGQAFRGCDKRGARRKEARSAQTRIANGPWGTEPRKKNGLLGSRGEDFANENLPGLTSVLSDQQTKGAGEHNSGLPGFEVHRGEHTRTRGDRKGGTRAPDAWDAGETGAAPSYTGEYVCPVAEVRGLSGMCGQEGNEKRMFEITVREEGLNGNRVT